MPYDRLFEPCRGGEQAKDMFLRLAKEYADRQGVTEQQLKVDKPLKWVQKMNNLRNAVEEVINEELVYASG